MERTEQFTEAQRNKMMEAAEEFRTVIAQAEEALESLVGTPEELTYRAVTNDVSDSITRIRETLRRIPLMTQAL